MGGGRRRTGRRRKGGRVMERPLRGDRRSCRKDVGRTAEGARARGEDGGGRGKIVPDKKEKKRKLVKTIPN